MELAKIFCEQLLIILTFSFHGQKNNMIYKLSSQQCLQKAKTFPKKTYVSNIYKELIYHFIVTYKHVLQETNRKLKVIIS